MIKINITKKIGELDEDHRPLADSELVAVSGGSGFFAGFVKQLLANSEPFGTLSDVRKGGAIMVYDYDFGRRS
jgi:hypothetical protein